MKKIISVISIATILCLISGISYAYPKLQLDASNAIYDTTTQTITNTSNVFTLYAFLNDSSMLGDTFYISAALAPKVEEPGSFGSFDFGGDTIDVTGDMTYGVPYGLPEHGIFETYYKEFSFEFSALNKADAYDVQNNPGGFDLDTGGQFYYQAFEVDLGNIAANLAVNDLSIHFDLYGKKYDRRKDVLVVPSNLKAPFSHDAQGISYGDNQVPEPATLMLFGFGLLCLSRIGRRRQL